MQKKNLSRANIYFLKICRKLKFEKLEIEKIKQDSGHFDTLRYVY